MNNKKNLKRLLKKSGLRMIGAMLRKGIIIEKENAINRRVKIFFFLFLSLFITCKLSAQNSTKDFKRIKAQRIVQIKKDYYLLRIDISVPKFSLQLQKYLASEMFKSNDSLLASAVNGFISEHELTKELKDKAKVDTLDYELTCVNYKPSKYVSMFMRYPDIHSLVNVSDKVYEIRDCVKSFVYDLKRNKVLSYYDIFNSQYGNLLVSGNANPLTKLISTSNLYSFELDDDYLSYGNNTYVRLPLCQTKEYFTSEFQKIIDWNLVKHRADSLKLNGSSVKEMLESKAHLENAYKESIENERLKDLAEKDTAYQKDNRPYTNIEVKLDSIVQLGKELRVSYFCNLDDDKDEIFSPIWYWDKNNKDYKIIAGPIHYTQYSSFIPKNGGELKKTNRNVYTYILSFSKEGVYNIPPMIATSKSGKLLKSKSFNVKVIKPTIKSKFDSSKSLEEDYLEIVASVDKNQISLGDSIELMISLYTKMFPPDISLSTPLSINNAYWYKKDFQFQSNIKVFNVVTYKGDTLVKAMTLAKYQIVPIQAGKLVIEPLSFNLTSAMKGNVGIIEKIFNNGKILKGDTVIMTKPITVHVDKKQIPAKKLEISAYTSNHNLGIVIDRSFNLLGGLGVSDSLLQLENNFIENFFLGESFSDYSVTIFAGKPHYPTMAELSDIQNVTPNKENNGSAIYDAILASALRDGALTSMNSPYSILLLTGSNDCSSRLSENTLTNILLKNRIRVDVVAFVLNNDSVNFVSKDGKAIECNQNFNDIERIAKATNGSFILVKDAKQITDVIRKIKEKRQKNETPKQLPFKSFVPDRNLLNTMYNEIIMDAKTDF